MTPLDTDGYDLVPDALPADALTIPAVGVAAGALRSLAVAALPDLPGGLQWRDAVGPGG